VRYQKGDQKRHFLGLRDTRDRSGSRRHRREPQFLHRDLEHRRIHRPRTDRVAADSLSGVLKGDRPRERGHPALTGRVRGAAPAAAKLTIAPPPDRLSAGTPYLHIRKMPRRLTAIVRSKTSSGTSTMRVSSISEMP